MNRTRGYIVLAAALVMQMCLGGIYAWSVFATPLQQGYGFTAGQTGLIFGTYMCVFTVALIFVGPLLDRIGPRVPCMISGVIFAGGYVLAGLSGGSFVLWWLGGGLLTGVAVGCAYVCPISASIQWFPDHKGLVSGLAVAGYGGAAIVLTMIGRPLLDAGWDVHRIFLWLGLIYGVIVVAMGMLMFLPPGHKSVGRSLGFRRRVLLTDRRFWLLFVPFFCSAITGTSIIGHLRSIGEWMGNSVWFASAAVITLAIGNSTGRVLVGFVYDRLGGRLSIILSLSSMVLAAGTLLAFGHSGVGLLAAAGFVGFCYGANFPIFAPEAARLHGVHLMGSVYPLVLFAHGLAPMVGPPVVGALRRATGSFAPGLVLMAAITLVGIVVILLFDRRREDQGA